MTQRTPEQAEREAILFDLKRAMQVSIHLYPPQPRGDDPLFLPIIWLHFTDFYSHIDLDRLVNRGFLWVTNLKPPTYGDYRDDFPPTAYRLTIQATYILRHPYEYVFEGKTFEPIPIAP